MCGIYGTLGNNGIKLSEQHTRISERLAHRGPNDVGFESGNEWALGFCRLSILDLSPTGHQPMSTPDGRYWLIFNGEIYNYLELRAALEKRGEKFIGNSDSEVLLRLLSLEGPAVLNKLNGMFAFAFVDTVARAFILARDRFGVKPLYYTFKEGSLRFASELKALLAFPDADKTVSAEAIAEYLALNYLPVELCIFQGYHKLLPGHCLTGSLLTPEKAVLHKFWTLDINRESNGTNSLSENQLEELSALLEDATRIRLRSDVPVGVFLSGGIDSGLTAAFAARQSGTSMPLALTVSFREAEYDEGAEAMATARHCGLPQKIIRQEPAGLELLDELAWYYDEPFGDASALPTYQLCKTAAQHATVFLSGDGGDEMFGGYRRYVEANRYRKTARVLQPFQKVGMACSQWFSPYSSLRYRATKVWLPDEGFAAVFDGATNDPVLECLAGEFLQDAMPQAGKSIWQRWNAQPGNNLLARQQQLEINHYLPDDILVKMDRASMANSIEVRSPFLDYRVAEWAARLPRSVLLNDNMGKLPLRALAARLLPEKIGKGVKKGFGVPLDAWFRQKAGKDLAYERLMCPNALERGWWKGKTVKKILQIHQTNRGRQFGGLIWRLLMLDAWARHYT